jgi:hypothetical protein
VWVCAGLKVLEFGCVSRDTICRGIEQVSPYDLLPVGFNVGRKAAAAASELEMRCPFSG